MEGTVLRSLGTSRGQVLDRYAVRRQVLRNFSFWLDIRLRIYQPHADVDM